MNLKPSIPKCDWPYVVKMGVGGLTLSIFIYVMVSFGCGCATTSPTSSTNGIPAFAMVEPGVWRGGPPPDKAGWVWLQQAGVSNVIKLDTWDEEKSDLDAQSLGMTVHYHPINTIQQLWDGPNSNDLRSAVMQIGPGSYVHCLHGQDRTGLVIAWHRLMEGTNKPAAYQEMLKHGFHPSLDGLQDFWERLTP